MAESARVRDERPTLAPVVGRPRSDARTSGGPASPTETEHCRLFSADWWLLCLAVFALMFFPGGTLSAIVFIGACAWIAQRNLALAWTSLRRCWPLLLLPALCMASALWSDDPRTSFKIGAELAATIVLAIVVFRRIGVRGLAVALLFAAALMCLLSLLYQRNALSSPFVGLTGSKNQMAFICQALFLSSIAVAVDGRNGVLLRLCALAGGALGLVGVALGQSAGVYVTCAAAFAAFAGLSVFSRIAFGARVAIVLLALLAVTPLVFAYDDVTKSVQTFQAEVLHKDATLTGRTELWTAARSVIAESPALGHGFASFWQQGNPDAEGLWRTNGIRGRSGFNFHNQFLDTWVDIGEVGLCVLVVALIYVGAGAIWRTISRPTLSTAFMTSLLVALYLRLPVESTLVGAWNLSTFLWIAIGVSAYSMAEEPSRARSPEPARGVPPRRAPWRHGHARPGAAFQPASRAQRSS